MPSAVYERAPTASTSPTSGGVSQFGRRPRDRRPVGMRYEPASPLTYAGAFGVPSPVVMS